ncbi:Myeloid leukemia factor [Dillenia turbinata]|uniref:Myeloid leukemia factor n=1 Tax=Dillenia turbinata TaxID=194707 RepID=A0AAN8UTD6_9MAGN
MQRERRDMEDLLGFGGTFGNLGVFGGIGDRSWFSAFDGRDPFDDPFFTRPFGSSIFGPSMFGPSSSTFGAAQNSDSPENRSKGPVIEELNSDDEEEGADEGVSSEKVDQKNYGSSRDPLVEVPNEETDEKKGKSIYLRNDYNKASQPQARNFSFQSSTVSYGGVDGAYYTSSMTRRTGSDGVVLEESKEANATTGQATHRISRGIHDRGHSVVRKLKSDGNVDTMQALHNLNGDELASFEEAWKDKEGLPEWNNRSNVQANTWSNGAGENGPMASSGSRRALPLQEHFRGGPVGGNANASSGKPEKVVRINID